ncbi:MAG: hypothetical protein V3V08_24945 [Nannocystaceae bacterium]
MSYLDAVIAAKREQLGGVPLQLDAAALERQFAAQAKSGDLGGSLRLAPTPRVIPQIGRRSCDDNLRAFDVRVLVRSLVDAGAPAVVVETYASDGSTSPDLPPACHTADVPVIWSDLVLCNEQLLSARVAGARAAVLLVDALDPPRLRELIVYARRIGIEPVCRVHDVRGVDRALAAGGGCIEASTRDLEGRDVDVREAVGLRARVPNKLTYLVRGEFATAEDIAVTQGAQIDAIVVGKRIMDAADPGMELMELAGAVVS